ncbi:hypothetical protein KUTeg_018398 [Tegillarca granosa]|uniref:Uncharacterized protein n=1 Tax=Tegillarca granosa TaxID=220873 RepID=A0ABQ9EN40_TEGGR|nr:hypothetical protein KUTeg_018398 [Tegillarca granosa]
MNLGFLPKRHQPPREICMSSSVTSERTGVTGSVLPGITGTSPAMNASRMEIRNKPIRRCQSMVHVRYKDENHHDQRIKHNNWIKSPPSSQEFLNDKKSDYKVSFKFISVPQQKKIINDSRKQLLAMSDEKSKKVLEGKLDKSQGEFVGRSGLTYQTPDSLSSKQQEQRIGINENGEIYNTCI